MTDTARDEYLIDRRALEPLVAEVRAALARHRGHVPAALEALRPAFASLLADQTWLPNMYACDNPKSGMGGGIGQWLLFRSADKTLTLFSLVVPPGSTTPVHDHLAWGLVGLYRGEQEEVVYRRADHDHEDETHAHLEVEEVRRLRPGDFYVLLPPEGDIHAVKTVSSEPSISIHLLGNDAGCTWRHAFEPEARRVTPFRSGYSNMPCPEDPVSA